jgi:hypothetical protein
MQHISVAARDGPHPFIRKTKLSLDSCRSFPSLFRKNWPDEEIGFEETESNITRYHSADSRIIFLVLCQWLLAGCAKKTKSH